MHNEKNHKTRTGPAWNTAFCCLASIGILLAGLSGCSKNKLTAAKNNKPTDADWSESRKERQHAAISDYEKSRNDALYQSAIQQRDSGSYAAAENTLQELISRDPDHKEGAIMYAEILLFRKQSQEALAQLDQLRRKYPQDSQVFHISALACESMGNNEEAMDHHQRAFELSPDSGFYRNNFETAKRNSSEGKAQRASFEAQIPQQRPGERDNAPKSSSSKKGPFTGPRERVLEATRLLQVGKPTQAVQFAQEALHDYPDYSPLYRVLGMGYYRLGEYESALSSLEQGLSLDKSDALSYFLKGGTLSKLGRSEEAALSYRQAASLDTTFIGVR